MVAGTVELRVRVGGALLGALLLVAGCVPPDFGKQEPAARTPVPATPGPPATGAVVHPIPEAPPAAPGNVAPPLPPARTAPPASAATQTLMTQSRAHQAAGNYEQAAASIERALRIEPRQPLLWLELGNIRLKEGDFAQAEGMGRKALSLSAGDAALTAKSEQLIATAKKR
jgi:hypothetical protein